MDKESKKIADALNNRPYTIAVDLDGTLAEMNGWLGFSHIGSPIPTVVKAVRAAKKKGNRIILHTCRITTMDNKINLKSLDTVRKWLKKHKVPCDEIWASVGKPFANEYWDDKAVRKP